MDHNLNNLEESKRNKIINSGYTEFAEQGYKRSSLNKILQEAGVSKGFFYHYFRNKEEFHNYLIEYSITVVADKLQSEQLIRESDFIQRLQNGAMYKIHISKKYPRMFDFLAIYYKSISHEEYLKIAERITGDLTQRILTENIDYSLFKDDLPLDIYMKMVHKYVAQISYEIGERINIWSIEQIMNYYSSELDDLKKVVYKKGDSK